jgi:hypothetical protein
VDRRWLSGRRDDRLQLQDDGEGPAGTAAGDSRGPGRRLEAKLTQLASRALNLIDAMILARTYGLEERMAQLDR